METRPITQITPDEAKEAFRIFYDIREDENFFQFQFKNDYPPPNNPVFMSAIVGYESVHLFILDGGHVHFSSNGCRRLDYDQQDYADRMLEYLRGIGIKIDDPVSIAPEPNPTNRGAR